MLSDAAFDHKCYDALPAPVHVYIRQPCAESGKRVHGELYRAAALHECSGAYWDVR